MAWNRMALDDSAWHDVAHGVEVKTATSQALGQLSRCTLLTTRLRRAITSIRPP